MLLPFFSHVRQSIVVGQVWQTIRTTSAQSQRMLTTPKEKKIRHYQNINLWARHPYLVFEEQFSCTIKFSLCLVWRLFEEQNKSKKNVSPFQTLFCYGLNNSRPLCVQIRLVSDLLSFALILFSMLCDRKQCMWVYILSRKQEILSNWDSDDRIQKLWSIYPTPYHERASKGKKRMGQVSWDKTTETTINFPIYWDWTSVWVGSCVFTQNLPQFFRSRNFEHLQNV